MIEIATGNWSKAEGDERVSRHHLVDRLYHWLMAAAVLILIGTAFLPIVGIQFAWVDIHWITGLVLAALVAIHIARALVWQDWRNMMLWLADLRDIWRRLWRAVSPNAAAPAGPGKYDALQKLYHSAIAVLILSLIGSGVLMLLKIDTPFWRRNPYWFSADTWGIIYVIHDFAAMAMISMVMIHIYFVLRPDDWYLLRSMFSGWISRKEYSAHYDTERWKP